jgi:hypothetical protein
MNALGLYEEDAGRFVLLDGSGNTRAVLGMFNGRADLRLYNADGNVSVSLQDVSLYAQAGLAR